MRGAASASDDDLEAAALCLLGVLHEAIGGAVRGDDAHLVGDLEREIIDLKVMNNPIGLAGDVNACGYAYDMSDGVIGIVVRVLRIALERAFLEGKTDLDWNTIGTAFRAWKDIEDDSKRYDPFLKGVRPATAKMIETVAGIMQ